METKCIKIIHLFIKTYSSYFTDLLCSTFLSDENLIELFPIREYFYTVLYSCWALLNNSRFK